MSPAASTAPAATPAEAYLTVTVKTASPSSSELVTIVSTKNGVTRYMPFLIGN